MQIASKIMKKTPNHSLEGANCTIKTLLDKSTRQIIFNESRKQDWLKDPKIYRLNLSSQILAIVTDASIRELSVLLIITTFTDVPTLSQIRSNNWYKKKNICLIYIQCQNSCHSIDLTSQEKESNFYNNTFKTHFLGRRGNFFYRA